MHQTCMMYFCWEILTLVDVRFVCVSSSLPCFYIDFDTAAIHRERQCTLLIVPCFLQPAAIITCSSLFLSHVCVQRTQKKTQQFYNHAFYLYNCTIRVVSTLQLLHGKVIDSIKPLVHSTLAFSQRSHYLAMCILNNSFTSCTI